jgi:hypothetical protein
MRSCVISAFVLAVVLAPAATFAQATTTGQPPAGQPPAGQPPAGQPPAEQTPATATAPKVAFTTPAGILLVPIKPDKTAVFEEMAAKLKAGLAKTQDATIQKQASGLKIYKSSEPFGPNALYVVIVDPAVANSEYDLFLMLSKTMTPDELRAPDTQEMWKRYTEAFASGLSKLSLTQLGG